MLLKIYFPAFLCALAFLATSCQNPNEKTFERVEHYENGQVSRQINIVNGKREGKMTDYYNDGKLMAERYFLHGKQDGKTVIYYPSGQIKEIQYYAAGKKQGGDTLWYEDGKIQFVTTLKDDKKDGYLRKWGPDGTLIYEAKYALDTLIEVKGQAINRNTSAAKPSEILKKQD